MLKNIFSLILILITLLSCQPQAQGLSDEVIETEFSEVVTPPIVVDSIFQDSLQPKDLLPVRVEFKDKNSIKLVSWNIRHLGRSKSAEEILAMAKILRNFDIVAIQEVVAKDPAGAQAVAKIADELNRMGSKWDYQISDPTKSPSANISERYAFLWKTSKVSLQHRAYLDKELEEICYREPYIAKFKTKKGAEDFYVINYHSRKYYDKPEEEIIHFIDYPNRLETKNILIAGDFNLDENHAVWKPLYHKGFTNSLYQQPTTLKMKCKEGNYINHAIDNIYFLPGIERLNAETIDFVQKCKYLELARGISDHLPIYIEFNLKN